MSSFGPGQRATPTTRGHLAGSRGAPSGHPQDRPWCLMAFVLLKSGTSPSHHPCCG